MISKSDIYEIGHKSRETYTDPPIDRCYDVCSNFQDLIFNTHSIDNGSVRVVPIYPSNSNIKHYIVELDSICTFSEGFVFVDPTIDQFSSDVQETSLSLGEDLPKIGIYTRDTHPY